jgi:hypothetical protein
MQILRYVLLLASVSLVLSCAKDEPVPKPAFELYVNNTYNELSSTFHVWLTDSEGKIVAQRQLPGSDTAILKVPGASADATFDCTVAQVTVFEATGSGVRDTSVVLNTYTKLRSGEQLQLRGAAENVQFTEIKFQITDMMTFDTIIVPDGITFSRPTVFNNFNGYYRVANTGTFWMRFLVNNEDFWRFAVFENVGNQLLDLGQASYTVFPKMIASPSRLGFPFGSTWNYKIEGIIDTAKNRYFPMGDLYRAPGGLVPVINYVDVFEPETDDVFFPPPPRPYKGFRVYAYGTDGSAGGYDYYIDRLYDSLPPTLPQPNWDIQPAVPLDGRLVGARCLNEFDALVLSKTRAGSLNYRWNVHLPANTNGTVEYRLPDVPTDFSTQYTKLRFYDFDAGMSARAERYDRYSDFAAIQRKRMKNDDTYWQAKAGFMAREERF